MAAETKEPKPPKAPAGLMDAAWLYVRENMVHWAQGAKKAMGDELAQDFPDARGPQLRHACYMAKMLHDACYKIGDLCRAEMLTREQAEAQLCERFPGFSPPTYAQAVSYGMFISR